MTETLDQNTPMVNELNTDANSTINRAITIVLYACSFEGQHGVNLPTPLLESDSQACAHSKIKTNPESASKTDLIFSNGVGIQ